MIENCNSLCTQYGLEFEQAVIDHEVNEKKSSIIERNVIIPGAGIQMDMLLYNSSGQGKFKFIQAKGGDPNKSRKPGARRTDSVKKAIADGVLLKSTLPGSWYTVYFSEMPKPGSQSERMIETALRAGMIDEVQYLPY